MVATRDKHRTIVSRHLASGETLQALINVNSGSTGAGSNPGTRITNVDRYLERNGIREKGINGEFSVADIWLALTDQRMLVFSGSWFTLAPKPKKYLTDLPRAGVRVAWRDERALRPCRLFHFVFPGDQHIVRLGEVDEEADRFVAALGVQATPLPPEHP
ncbi:MAG: hypothetical protein KDB21_05410 [Acidimicrobiales bacterium]|nr:hypothetical protein [Acidimicrobiales bacterium]